MAIGGAGFAIATAPFVPKSTLWWTLPILGGNPVIFWLWARANFDDDFTLRRWHGALWLLIVGIGGSVAYTWTTSPLFAKAAGQSLSVAALLLSFAAAAQTVRTWSADLVAGRRRLRLAVLILCLLLIVLLAGSDLALISPASYGVSRSMLTAAGLLAVAAIGGWSLFHPPAPASAAVAMAAATDPSSRVAPIEPRGDGGREGVTPLLLRRLDHLMAVDRIYRREGLTIGMLAARLDLPEYRLRQVINEGLGYRNFNAFLNRYRLDEAKAALSDPSQREVPVLTIAMDSGFQSIGPFNRAFKADTGVTPTEFRRDAIARAQSTALQQDDNFGIGQSRREFG
jgi:AraC-like DNA-binding protein